MTTLFPHRESSAQVSAAVIVFPGSNGDHDLLQALTLCGFSARFLDAEQEIPIDVSLVAYQGAFPMVTIGGPECWLLDLVQFGALLHFFSEAGS